MQINNNSKKQPVKFKKEFEDTPLKQFLKCGECGTSFAGYLVKKKGLYYYKCNKKGCKCNRSAKLINGMFVDYLSRFQIQEKFIEPIKDEFIGYVYRSTENNKQNEKLYKTQLTEVLKKIEMLEERFVTAEINRDLYEKFSQKYQQEKRQIEQEMDNCRIDLSNLEKQVNSYMQLCLNLASLWVKANYKEKTEIQNLIFPEGIWYDRTKNDYRTSRINSVVSCISTATRALENPSKRKTALQGGFPGLVEETMPKSNQLIIELGKIQELEFARMDYRNE